MIPLSELESVKSQIVQVISDRISLTKRGSSWLALCPFHQEKTPSFSVNEKRLRWHCFGCGAGGDAISFIEKFHGVNFKEALRILGASEKGSFCQAAPVIASLKEIDKDAKTLLTSLKAREKKTILIFQTVGRQLVKTPPLEIPARWYLREQICEQTFEDIDRERLKIDAIKQKHKRSVLSCKA